MKMAEAEKMVYIVTHAGEDPERATFPFMLATAAQAMEVEAVVALQGVSVFLAKKGYLENVVAAGLPALKDLVKNFLEAGGKLLICTPCIRERNIEESELIEGSELIAAARLNQEILSANATLVY
ncbi:MAG: DsrE family protein [Deltaproteobacteria bacterium]|nr:MAG: DsrE family protein [Deltaproteobacteria bacterium]